MTVVYSGLAECQRDSPLHDLDPGSGFVPVAGTYTVTFGIDESLDNGSLGYASVCGLGVVGAGGNIVAAKTKAPGGDGWGVEFLLTFEDDGAGGLRYSIDSSHEDSGGVVTLNLGAHGIAAGTELTARGSQAAGPHRPSVGMMTWSVDDGAVAPEPPPDPGDVVVVVDDDDVFIDTLVNISDKVIRIERQGWGSGSFRIRRDATDASLIGTGQDGRMVKVTIPRISSDPIFRWMIENIETVVADEREQGEELISVAGRGALAYIGRAVSSPFTYVVPSGPVEVHKGPASTGQKAGQILRRAIAEYQHVARPQQPIPLITVDFDYDDDSNGDPWDTTDATEEMAVGYTGENALVGLQELWGTGGIDMLLKPDGSMLLQAFNYYGRDLTGSDFGAGIVRFVKGVNIADRLTRTRGTELPKTHIWVEGDDMTFLDPPASLPGGGSRPVVESFMKTIGTDPDFLEAVGISALVEALRRGESVAFNVAIPYTNDLLDEDTGQYLPGPPGSNGHFWIGDTVTVSTGTGVDDFEDEDARIEAITIWFDDANNLRVKVELKATTILGRIGPTTGSAGAFGGVGPGSVGGAGGTTPPPSPVSSDLHDHEVDPTDAHDASAISVLDSGANYAATNVETALAEVMDEVQAHEADTTDAHDASAISVLDAGGHYTGTDVEAVLAEIFGMLGGGSGDATGQLGAGFDGGLSVLVAPKSQDVVAPYDGDITGWRVYGQQSGDANFAIAKADHSGFDTFSSIVGATAPSLSSAKKNQGTDMTGWTTSVAAGDILRFTLSTVSAIRQVVLVLDYDRT